MYLWLLSNKKSIYSNYTKGRRKNNPKFWVTKELYYNLDYYDLCEEDSEYPSKRFCFLTAEEAVEGNYFKVKQILAYDELQDFLEYAMNAKMTKKCRTDLSVLFNRLHDSSGTGLIIIIVLLKIHMMRLWISL